MAKTTSHQQFEEWAAPRHYYLARWMDGYANWDVQQMFIGWSARDSIIQTLCDRLDELNALRDEE